MSTSNVEKSFRTAPVSNFNEFVVSWSLSNVSLSSKVLLELQLFWIIHNKFSKAQVQITTTKFPAFMVLFQCFSFQEKLFRIFKSFIKFKVTPISFEI